MACPFTTTEIAEQITALKAMLIENTTATSAALQSIQYSLDTGQTRQSVMRQQLSQLRGHRSALLQELHYWQGLADGSVSTHLVPGY
jgi:hypothetical protein